MTDGYADPKYTWYKDGKIVITAPSSPKSNRFILLTGSLFFPHVRQNKKVQLLHGISEPSIISEHVKTLQSQHLADQVDVEDFLLTKL